jgi:hypothetical protein
LHFRLGKYDGKASRWLATLDVFDEEQRTFQHVTIQEE